MMDQRTNNNNPQQKQLIGAIDQGTSSTRFLVFENGSGQLIASSQIQIERIVPKEGWVEIDPMEIIKSVQDTISNVHKELVETDENLFNSIKCIGICNQRESTVVWDRITGKPLNNVIVWMDNRTKDLVDQLVDSVPGRDINFLKDKTGLPMSTYFSAFKLKWLIDNVKSVKDALKEDRLLFGTVDTWILWNLTGGKHHLTDVTNASRTFLMDIETLEWDKSLCDYFTIPAKILPRILASADDFGLIESGPLNGLPITGVIGDQSAALFGHHCLQIGQTKATFGTGCFIMQNIGPGPLNGAMSGVHRDAKRGLITTVGYKLKDTPAHYALEGSIKIAGAGFAWLRDNLQLITDLDECDQLVNKTTNSAGVFFVPALGGLYSPYWDPNASGIFIGLSQFSRREHLVRATFDSIAFQTNDILSLMRGVASGLMIDGGLCKSDHMCQILADLTGCDIVRPSMCETSALGAAMVAGCGANIWSYGSLLAKANLPFDSYGFASSPEASVHHYHPQQSLYYEEKFSALIESKSRQLHEDDQKSNSQHQDHQEDEIEQKMRQQQQTNEDETGTLTNVDNDDKSNFLVSHSKLERVNEAIGVNDDAGGGGGIDQPDDDHGSVDSNQLESSLECSSGGINSNEEDLLYSTSSGEVCDSELLASCQANGPFRPSSVGLASSGYSSGDNFEHSSLIAGAQRQDSPYSDHRCSTFEMILENRSINDMNDQDEEREEEREEERVEQIMNDDNLEQNPEDNNRLSSIAQTSHQISSSKNPANKSQLIMQCTTDALNACSSSRPMVNLAPVDVFQSYISLEHRVDLVHTWHRAVERSMQWTKIDHEEVRRIDYQRLSSLPISMYLFLSIGMVAFSGFMHYGVGGSGGARFL